MSDYAAKNGYVLHDIDGVKFDGLDGVYSTKRLRALVLKDKAEGEAAQGGEQVAWRAITDEDREVATIQTFGPVTLRNSHPAWVRDDDGRAYEAVWTVDDKGRGYWWDIEAESPVDPIAICPHPLAALSSPAPEGEAEPGVSCETCQGNGEIVTDWERYQHARPGDVGDEAVADCPDCGGTGRTDAAPEGEAAQGVEPPLTRDELDRYVNKCRELSSDENGNTYAWWSRLADILAALSPPSVKQDEACR